MPKLSLPPNTQSIGTLSVGQDGLHLIERSESLRLEAYPDPATKAEPITIGYGHTGGVKLGDKITVERAEQLLSQDVHFAVVGIQQTLGNDTQLPQASFDALVSLVFNIGVGNFASSSVARCIKNKDYQAAADAFLLWNKARVGGVLTVMGGLNTRRALERGLFLSGFPGAEDIAPGTSPTPTPAADSPQPQVITVHSSRSTKVKKAGGLALTAVGTAVGNINANALSWSEPLHQASQQIGALGGHGLHTLATGLAVAGIGLAAWGHLAPKRTTTVQES